MSRGTGILTFKLYDIVGREVLVFDEKAVDAGIYRFEFEGRNLATGVYFLRTVCLCPVDNIPLFQSVDKVIFLK